MVLKFLCWRFPAFARHDCYSFVFLLLFRVILIVRCIFFILKLFTEMTLLGMSVSKKCVKVLQNEVNKEAAVLQSVNNKEKS